MSNVAWFANLPHETTEDEMRAVASKAGKITAVEMGRRGMMSWVTYSSPAEASKALSLTGTLIRERDVRVELATRDPNAPPREKPSRAPREPRSSPVANNGAPAGEREPAPRYTDRISVRGIAPEASEAEVIKVFGSAGEILKTRIRPNETTIQYATAAAAQHAITSLNNTLFEGSTKPLNIKFLVRRKRASRRGGKSSSGGEAKPEGGAGRSPRAARDPAAAPSGRGRPRRVDVKNVPASASEAHVRTFFDSCGAIDRLTMNDEVVSITFSTPEGAELALAKSGGAIGGGRVEVVVSPSVPRNRTPRAADGDEPRAGRARSRPEASPAAVSSLIWIGGLQNSTDEASVRKMYGSYGKISEVVIKHMRDTSKPSFAYVRFETDAAASNALAAPAAPGLTVQRANKLPQSQ